MYRTVTTSLLLSSAVLLSAQSAPTHLPPPIAAQQIIFRHWPEQFVQWVGTEVPYSMIELYADAKSDPKAPLYEVVLTERASGKRVHYTNQPSMLELDKRSGADAYLTNIQLDRPASGSTDATYLVRFVDSAGEPVSWQWIQGSDMSERGGGTSPAGLAPPVLMYRALGAVAGEGSALKVGKNVSVAEMWTEISHPPYFIAYHGAYSQNVDMAVFAGQGMQWTITSAPTALAVGAEWKLQAQDGLGCTLRVQSLAGNHATVIENDDHLAGRTITLEASWNAPRWSIEKMHYAAVGEDANQGVTIAFAPAVSSGEGQSKFEVFAGHKTRIATGTLHGDPAQPRVGWEFKDPEWLRGRTAWVNSVVLTAKSTTAQTASR